MNIRTIIEGRLPTELAKVFEQIDTVKFDLEGRLAILKEYPPRPPKTP